MKNQKEDQPSSTSANREELKPKENGAGRQPFGLSQTAKIWLEILLLIFGLVAVPLAIKSWIESQVEKSVQKTLNDESVLRKIAAHSRPSLIFNGKGSILHDMGAAQYLKPDDISITERVNDQGFILPVKLHIGFVRPISFAPLVTPLNDTASLTASNGKGLDWEFTINWTVVPTDTNDTSRVYRLELVP